MPKFVVIWNEQFEVSINADSKEQIQEAVDDLAMLQILDDNWITPEQFRTRSEVVLIEERNDIDQDDLDIRGMKYIPETGEWG